MWKRLAVLASLTLCSPAFAGPGIDLSANGICPGISGASGDGGALDCAALAKAGDFVSLIGTFMTAEDIPDLDGLGWSYIDIDIMGDFADNGAFWVDYDGSCLAQNGGTIRILYAKPTLPGRCGNSLQIRDLWDVGLHVMPIPTSDHHATLAFTTGGRGGTGYSVTTSQRIFGFELRFDPTFSAEAGGPCGSCKVPICFTWTSATLDVGASHTITTPLTGPTGLPGVSNVAFFNAGCGAVPTRARTWGQLKSLYR